RQPIGREYHPINLNHRRASGDTWWGLAHITRSAACHARIAEKMGRIAFQGDERMSISTILIRFEIMMEKTDGRSNKNH
ncbi:MAG: hypothetical protein VX107_14955, partial [Pseudomonadota bacterium]|nr:hypothetical protein [Pseudomonadota bacterium]